MIKTFHILLLGIVQGVGFRPMLYYYASQNNIKGYVCNASDGLHFEFNASEETAKKILTEITASAPVYAKITSATLKEVEYKLYDTFVIIESNTSKNNTVLLTPDYAVCKSCKEDVNNKDNRRYRYPFTTCAICGPRYSIITALPYDRKNTTMQSFTMCEFCSNEYHNIKDRRYFAQTISCNECGVQMQVYDNAKKNIVQGNDKALTFINNQLKNGKIIAVKGIGGYLLVCDATNAHAVNLIRQRKHRPAKPFAIMCSSIEQANKYAVLNDKEKELLQSSIAPVVVTKSIKSNLALNEIAPNLNTIGIMLSYAPLFDIILQDFELPIVATSGNISGSPIIYNDIDAVEKLCAFADFVITHNREIVMPQDDSVITITPKTKQQIILRRSRGLAPTFFHTYTLTEEKLATGGMLKSSFAFSANNNIYVSQYLGNTDNYDTQKMYKHSLQCLQKIVDTNPKKVCTDLHPQYFSHQLANTISNNVEMVQHHKAHFVSVLTENNLLGTANVLGVIWDGTGLGEDKAIHGGEFYKYDGTSFLRCYHFDYFPFILADKMPKEPRIAALAICYDIMGATELLQSKFTDMEWDLYLKLLNKEDVLQCSSVGRIFDAVASLLQLSDIQSYEGEAALLLQQLAQEYFTECDYGFKESYFSTGAHYYRLPTATLFTGIIMDIKKQKDKKYIAAKFHYSLIHITSIIAKNTGCDKIAFSGGVLQNALLVDLMQLQLSDDFSLFFHKQLSPNDEGIALGQLFINSKT